MSTVQQQQIQFSPSRRRCTIGCRPYRICRVGATISHLRAFIQHIQTRINRPRVIPQDLERLEPGEKTAMELETQDVQYATLLSELVYRAAECKTEESFQAHLTALEQELGASMPNIRHHKSGGQRYLVSESDAAIYVAFQGTRTPTDWLANLAFFHGPLWHQRQSRLSRSSSSSSSTSSNASSGGRSSSRAHGGFLRRANHAAMSIDALHAAAAASGKRLVLTGHSLGGAVATLTTVRLLRSLTLQREDLPDPRIRCISFATPAVANTDLLQEVAAAGWDRFITNILLPEDPVVPFVNLLLKAPAAPSVSAVNSSNSICPKHSRSSTASNASTRILASFSSPTTSSESNMSISRSNSLDSLDELQYRQYSQLGQLWQYDAQQQAFAAQAAVGCSDWECEWYTQQGMPLPGQVYAHATTGGAASYALGTSGASQELTSWLVAARGAVQQQRRQRRQQQMLLHRSLSEASEANSSSSNSLTSLAPSTNSAESSSGSTDSLAAFVTGLEATIVAASTAAAQMFGGSSGSGFTSERQQPAGGSTLLQSPSKRFNFRKAGVTAFVTGALAAGVRCSAALAAPQLLAPHVSLLSLIPAAFTAPVAIAAVHLVSKVALPVSHPLGQQFVMMGTGLEPVCKPLKSYPRSGEGLNLKQLGGLFPGHRMIAYRRRMVTLLQQQRQEI